MAAAVVGYLLQQGYRPDQLVVLTPYLGQMLELQREISKTTQVGHIVHCLTSEFPGCQAVNGRPKPPPPQPYVPTLCWF